MKTDRPMADWLPGPLARPKEGPLHYRVTESQELWREPSNKALCLCNSVMQEGMLVGSLPVADGEWHLTKCLFTLARQVRALRQSHGLLPQDFRPLVREWLRQAGDRVPWSEFEAWAEFCRVYEAVKFPAGVDPVAVAWERAREASQPPGMDDCDDVKLLSIAKLCWELSKIHDGRPFYLSSYRVAELLGETQPRAWRLLAGLCSLGVLHRTKKGTHGTNRNVRHSANEYQYICAES